MFSIIIPTPTWNAEHLKACVNSIIRMSDKNIEIIIVPNDGKTTFEKEINRGIGMATGDVICLCNDDVLFFDMEWQAKARPFLQDPKVGIVTVFGNCNFFSKAGPMIPFWFVLFRRNVLEEVGRLDESFSWFGSDHDWCMRAYQKGFTAAFFEGCVHHVQAGTASKRGDIWKALDASKRILTERWGDLYVEDPERMAAFEMQYNVKVYAPNMPKTF